MDSAKFLQARLFSRLIRILVDPQTLCSQRKPYVCRWHEPFFDNFCWWSEVLKGLACSRFGKWSPGFGFMDYRTHLHISILGSSVFCFCVFLAHSILSWIYAKRVLVSSQNCIYMFSQCLVSFPGVIRSGFSLQDATRGKMLSLVHDVHLKNIPPQKA